jgi:transcriptional regulator of acetoin/glycerol metabolism
MKAIYAITVSGADKSFKGGEVLGLAETYAEGKKERARLEKETGRITYLSRIADLPLETQAKIKG